MPRDLAWSVLRRAASRAAGEGAGESTGVHKIFPYTVLMGPGKYQGR